MLLPLTKIKTGTPTLNLSSGVWWIALLHKMHLARAVRPSDLLLLQFQQIPIGESKSFLNNSENFKRLKQTIILLDAPRAVRQSDLMWALVQVFESPLWKSESLLDNFFISTQWLKVKMPNEGKWKWAHNYIHYILC